MATKIDAMIVGAQKAGTTSLNYYLSQYPDITTHFTQEFGMFSDSGAFDKGFYFFFNNSVKREFANRKFFVAKHARLMYEKELLVKLKSHNPDVKIIVILRNPIDRAYSAFWYFRRNGLERYTSFEDCIYINDLKRFKNNLKAIKNCNYIELSKYYKYIKDVFEIFPSHNIKICIFEEMIKNLNESLIDICKFCNLTIKFEFDTTQKRNEKSIAKYEWVSQLTAPGRKSILKFVLPFSIRIKLRRFIEKFNNRKENVQFSKITPATRKHLADIFRDDVNKLNEMLDIPLKDYWKDFA